MNQSNDHAHLEAMGLRLEPMREWRPLEVCIDVAVMLSGAVWLWLAVAGVEPSLTAFAGSLGGRPLAAFVGVAVFSAVGRRRVRE